MFKQGDRWPRSWKYSSVNREGNRETFQGNDSATARTTAGQLQSIEGSGKP